MVRSLADRTFQLRAEPALLVARADAGEDRGGNVSDGDEIGSVHLLLPSEWQRKHTPDRVGDLGGLLVSKSKPVPGSN